MPRHFPLLAIAALLALRAPAADRFVYFGSHSSRPGAGFSLARFDTETGVQTRPEFLLAAKEPAFFVIAQATGRLTPVEHVASRGRTPRNFAFDPTGRWIICTNHGGDNAAVFRVDETTGRPIPATRQVQSPV